MPRLLKIQPELKPLVAQLRRVKIGQFLHTDEFEHIVLERDWDALWHAAKSEIQRTVNVVMIGLHDTTIEEDAFALWLNLIYSKDLNQFEDVLSTTIKAFVAWNEGLLDLDPLCESVAPLNLHSGCRAVLRAAAEQSKSKAAVHKLPTISQSEPIKMGKNVFVVHGHDEARRRELCTILKEELGLEPKVVQDEPNDSIETILGKIERLAGQCHVAVILMTADDEMKSGRKRARQNVVLELGYFLGLWRKHDKRKIIVIQAPGVDAPSDINGVLYLEYNSKVQDVFLPLKKQLKHWGIEVS